MTPTENQNESPIIHRKKESKNRTTAAATVTALCKRSPNNNNNNHMNLLTLNHRYKIYFLLLFSVIHSGLFKLVIYRCLLVCRVVFRFSFTVLFFLLIVCGLYVFIRRYHPYFYLVFFFSSFASSSLVFILIRMSQTKA